VAPRLIVIDYAETRLAVVQPLLYKMGVDLHRKTPPVRLLLLARRAGDWWTGLKGGTADREIQALLAQSEPHRVVPLAPAVEKRRRVYHTTLAAFAEELGRTVPANPPAPDLEKSGFERALYLHMAALAALDGRSIRRSAAEALAETLHHERRFWHQQVEEMRLDGSLTKSVQDAFGRAVAALTLVGGTTTESQARSLFGRVLDGFPTRPDLPEAILDGLRQMYRGDGDGRFLEPLQPDVLGEELVAEILRRDSRLLDKLLDGAPPDEGRGTLTVLTRLAQRRPEAEEWLRAAFRGRLEALAENGLEVAVETGDPIGLVLAREVEESAKEGLAKRLMDRCDEARYISSLPLREVALAATLKKRDLFEARHSLLASPPEEISVERARLANNLGYRLKDLGRREEALKATEEAVDIHRDLAGRRPDAFLPDLAKSLNNLGNSLRDLGRREEALKATEEAVDVYRDLAGRRPDAFLPDLAMSLNNLGTMLSDLGRREEALKATEEAVDVYRDLAGRRPDAFLPVLATSLNNLGNKLSDLERREEALKATEEAVRILSPFFLRYPSAFGSWMKIMAVNYLKRSEETGQALDEELLRPIVEILAAGEER
jgi:tetratricopeptide (TPR) repeat protein